MNAGRWSIGIDLGGTKTEAVALDAAGQACWRQRIATPSAHGYDAMLDAICRLVDAGRSASGGRTTVGVGAPGSLTADGLVKNANTTCLNGRPLQQDLQRRLGQPVALANDANCLALSEATDGAGQGAPVVFAAILGTGCGAGIAVDGRVLTGPNRLAGEWGHNPLPWADADAPRPACYCGQSGCVETLCSGPAIATASTRNNARPPASASAIVTRVGIATPGKPSELKPAKPVIAAMASSVAGRTQRWRTSRDTPEGRRFVCSRSSHAIPAQPATARSVAATAATVWPAA